MIPHNLRSPIADFLHGSEHESIPDGECGESVRGKLFRTGKSLAYGGLPQGLAHQVKLTRAIQMGQSLT